MFFSFPLFFFFCFRLFSLVFTLFFFCFRFVFFFFFFIYLFFIFYKNTSSLQETNNFLALSKLTLRTSDLARRQQLLHFQERFFRKWAQVFASFQKVSKGFAIYFLFDIFCFLFCFCFFCFFFFLKIFLLIYFILALCEKTLTSLALYKKTTWTFLAFCEYEPGFRQFQNL